MKTHPNTIKVFRVISRSKANSFGLHGHVLVARDGEAWEVGRVVGSWLKPWAVGSSVSVVFGHDGKPLFSGCELPRPLPHRPPKIVRSIFEGVKAKS